MSKNFIFLIKKSTRKTCKNAALRGEFNPILFLQLQYKLGFNINAFSGMTVDLCLKVSLTVWSQEKVLFKVPTLLQIIYKILSVNKYRDC